MPTSVIMSDFDLPTRSASGFILRYIAPRVEPVHLFSFLARRLPFRLTAPQSDIIIGVGHGSPSRFSGQNMDLLLEAGNLNPREVRGKVIKLLSCLTAVSLGPDLVNNGAAAFLGYKDDFVWVLDQEFAMRPFADPLAAKSLMPVVSGVNLLLDGATVQEAFNAELTGYSRNAEVEEDELIKACLEFNHDSAVLLGDPNTRIRKRPPLPFPFRLLEPPPLPTFGFEL